MKRVLVGTLLLMSSSSFTKEVESIHLECRGEVRCGRLFGDPVHIAFDKVLAIKLAKQIRQMLGASN